MPAAAVAIGGAISAGTSIIRGISAGKRAKAIQQQIDDYKRQQLTNPYEGLNVSTMGADLQRQDIARSIATGTNQLALGGSRALVGGLPNMLDQQIAQEQKIAADLDQQYNQNQQLKAQGYGMVQGMQEQREKDDLLGLGNALNTARQEQSNAWNQLAQTGGSLMTAGTSGMFNGLIPKKEVAVPQPIAPKAVQAPTAPPPSLSNLNYGGLYKAETIEAPVFFDGTNVNVHKNRIFRSPKYLTGWQ